MFRFDGALSAVLVCFASIASAEPHSELGHSDLIAACIEAIDIGDSEDAYEAANELRGRSGFNLGSENRTKGAACLEAVYGVAFEFKDNRFVSEDLQKMAAALEEEVANLEDKRRNDYAKALVTACFEEYEIDRFRALTTPVCAEVFKTLGLPGTQ